MNLSKPAAFAIFAIASLVVAPSGYTKDKEKDSSGDEVQVEKLTLVRDAGDSFKTVESFKPTDTFGVLCKLSDAKPGTKVKAIWILVKAGDMENKQLLEKEVEFTEETLKNAKIKDRVDFTLSHDNPYPTGDYKVEIYLNGELADSIDFTIE